MRSEFAGDGEVADVGLLRLSVIAVKVDEGDFVVDGEDQTVRGLNDAQDIAADGVDVLRARSDDAPVLVLQCSLREESGELVGAAVHNDRANGVAARNVVGEVDSEPLLRSTSSDGGKGEGGAEEGDGRSDD